MEYQLAKELKDAGFPGSESWIDNGKGFFVDQGELVFVVPALTELIEACDPPLLSLTRHGERWVAYSTVGIDGVDQAEGSTPEEAVALLWLAIHTKPSNT